MDTNDNIIDKLKYLGLDLDNIPNSIKEFKPLEYRPLKYSYEHVYKIYKYIDINDIQILLTPTNRLSSISEKYRKSNSIIPIFRPKYRRKYRKAYQIFIYVIKDRYR